jgi:hypothetical protein
VTVTFVHAIGIWETILSAGLKPPAQYLEALRTGANSRVLPDFHELRQDFSPQPESDALTTLECSLISNSFSAAAPLEP